VHEEGSALHKLVGDLVDSHRFLSLFVIVSPVLLLQINITEDCSRFHTLSSKPSLGLEINWFKASAFKFYDCLELLIVFSLGKKCVEEAGPTGPLGRSHCPCPSCRVGPTTPGSPEWDSGAIPPPLEEACIGHLLLGRPSWTQLLQKTD